MERLDEALAGIITKLDQLSDAYGSEVFELAGAVAMLEMRHTLILCFVGLIFAAAVACWLPFFLRRFNAWEKKLGEGIVIPVVATIAASIGACFAGVAAVINILDPRLWAGISDPKIALAVKLLY